MNALHGPQHPHWSMSCPLRCFFKSSHVCILQWVPGPQGLRVERGLTPHKPTILYRRKQAQREKENHSKSHSSSVTEPRSSPELTQIPNSLRTLNPHPLRCVQLYYRAEVRKAFWKLPLWLQLQTQLIITSFERSSSQRKQQPGKICSRKLTEAAANQLPGEDTFVGREELEMLEGKESWLTDCKS